MKRSKISSVEWWLVIGALGTVDLIQIVLDLFAIGVAANRFIDIAVGMALALYLLIRGEPFKPLVILGTFGLEMLPLVDALPFWVLDGFYYKSQAKTRNKAVDAAEASAQQEQMETEMRRRQMLQAQLAAEEEVLEEEWEETEDGTYGTK